jgi:hypothetical protein
MTVQAIPTISAAELAEWERRLRSGALFDAGQPRYAYYRPRCRCGHREGSHGYRDGYGRQRYGGACHGTRCLCEQFVEAGE